ncbi:MAG TPA: peroxidase family protein, partial [Xanthobacteraceae bacterium]|nr:peroxidase family protein [Xanthobacteraceae bacterium]
MRHSKGHSGSKHSGDRDFDIGDFFADFFWPHHHHDGHGSDDSGRWNPPAPEPKIAYRTADGSQNNKFDTTLNAAGTEFGRIGEAHFADGISEPLGGNNPRTISNLVVGAGDADVANPEGVSAFMYAWGQFIDHDMTLTRSDGVNHI